MQEDRGSNARPAAEVQGGRKVRASQRGRDTGGVEDVAHVHGDAKERHGGYRDLEQRRVVELPSVRPHGPQALGEAAEEFSPFRSFFWREPGRHEVVGTCERPKKGRKGRRIIAVTSLCENAKRCLREAEARPPE